MDEDPQITQVASVTVSREQLTSVQQAIHQGWHELARDGYRPERIEMDRRFEPAIRYLPDSIVYGFGAYLGGIRIERHDAPVLRLVGRGGDTFKALDLKPFQDDHEDR